MAGDWLKFEVATLEKPEVYVIAEVLEIDPDAVIGKLLRVWSWFDQQSRDGYAPSVTQKYLDRITGAPGFCEAMVHAGWMRDDGERISLPNFTAHNGKTAKSRALSAKRMANKRAKELRGERNGSYAASVTDASPREEKRREQGASAPDADFWRHAKAALGEVGIAESTAGSIVGKLSQALGINTKTASPDKLTELLQLIETGCAKTNPRQWLMACCTEPPKQWATVHQWIANGCPGDVPGDETTKAILADHLPELQTYPADLARARFVDYYRVRAGA